MSHWLYIVCLALLYCANGYATHKGKEERFRIVLAGRIHTYHKVYLNRHLQRYTQGTTDKLDTDKSRNPNDIQIVVHKRYGGKKLGQFQQLSSAMFDKSAILKRHLERDTKVRPDTSDKVENQTPKDIQIIVHKRYGGKCVQVRQLLSGTFDKGQVLTTAENDKGNVQFQPMSDAITMGCGIAQPIMTLNAHSVVRKSKPIPDDTVSSVKETKRGLLKLNEGFLNSEAKKVESEPVNNESNRPAVNQIPHVNDTENEFNPEELQANGIDVTSLKTSVRENMVDFYLGWQSLLAVLSKTLYHQIGYDERQLSLTEAIVKVGSTDSYMNSFWPFKYDFVEMNQRIAFLGFNGDVEKENLKSSLYKSLYEMYSLPVPFAEDTLIISFNEQHIANLLTKSNLLNGTDEYMDGKGYAYSATERTLITNKINAAMELIHETAPELYHSINKLIACIAVYKSEQDDRIGGSSSDLPGIIYITPRQMEWPVIFYAEQIVHEFIHNVLYFEELVMGTYNNYQLLSKTKVLSTIRGVERNYDLSFHAAYVTTGLVVFHSRAGYHARAEYFAGQLARPVQALVNANNEVGVLTTAGEAMLQTIVDYVGIMKLGQIEM